MQTHTRYTDSFVLGRPVLPQRMSKPDKPLDAAALVAAGPLSSYWRKNVSPSEAVELANLLRALRKVAGHLGPNVGRIEYLGMSHGDPAAIVVDPTLVMGQYPVPPRKVDYLVGLVVHEALGQIEWSERVFKILAPRFKEMPGLLRVMFQKMIKTGEDIYADRIADRSILGAYVRQTRGRALVEAAAKLRSEILTVDALIYLWWVSTWNPRIEQLMEPVYEKPLADLHQLTRKLEEVPDLADSVTRRCEIRAEHYLETWRILEPVCQRLTLLDKRLVWMDEGSVRAIRPPAKGQAQSLVQKPPLAPALIHEISAHLASRSSDITPLIAAVAGPDNPDIAPMSRWDFNIPAHPVVDRRTVARLKAVFLNYADRHKVVNRGLASGKVDRRRLYRAPMTGRCFSQVDKLPRMDWNVTLLLDATGSMRGNKWRMVENTVGNIHKALAGFDTHLAAWAYFEVDGICMLSRLINKRKLLSVPPAGQTASGQALIAAACFMPKDGRRNLLIHVTDGESNFGVDVGIAIDFCDKRKIHLVTLGCGCKEKKTMEAQYGKTIQFISHFGQLSQAVEKLLKWTFLYGAKRRITGDPGLKKLFAEAEGACNGQSG